MDEIVQAFFPVHPVRADIVGEEVSTVECPLLNELEEKVLTMKNKKASGPDGR